MRKEFATNDEKPTVADENDCEVTVKDGSWMTCDMTAEDESADTEDDGRQLSEIKITG